MDEKTQLPPDFEKELKDEYEKHRRFYEKLVDEVKYILTGSLERNGIKIHSLTSRETKIKTFKSFYKKVVKKEIMANQFEVIEDIAGVRVICLYRSDLIRLEELISADFDVLKADTSRTRTTTPFGYQSDHYIVKLAKDCTGPRYDDIKNFKCEIQVRTILMDAWDSVSHHLDYKQEIDIPKELRADFNALSGLFYVADTHFGLFRKGYEEARANLMKSVQEDVFNLDQEINLDSLTAYFKWKFPERIGIAQISSEIVLELKEFEYENMRQLDEKVNLAFPMLKEIEKEIFKQEEWKPSWHPDGVIRVCLDLTDEKYSKRRSPKGTREIIAKYRNILKAHK